MVQSVYVVCTLYVQCGVWCDVCGVVGFCHVHTAFLMKPYTDTLTHKHINIHSYAHIHIHLHTLTNIPKYTYTYAHSYTCSM